MTFFNLLEKSLGAFPDFISNILIKTGIFLQLRSLLDKMLFFCVQELVSRDFTYKIIQIGKNSINF